MDVWDQEFERTQSKIEELQPWPQNICLPNGLETAPRVDGRESEILEGVIGGLPADLAGRTALVAGCLSGFYVFALAARGVQVLGIEPDGGAIRQARWLRAKLGHRKNVRLRQAPVYSMARMDESFDMVLLMDCLARVRYPALALDLAVERSDEHLVVQAPTADLQILHPETVRRLSSEEGPGRLRQEPQHWTRDPTALEARLRGAGTTPRSHRHNVYVCKVETSKALPELLAATGRPTQRRG